MKNNVMCEPCREQRPLLCEESDEEFPHSTKLFRSSNRYYQIRGRARYAAKGAAAVISRWPDHWSTSFFYWCVAVGLFFLFTMVILNSYFALLILPATYSKSILKINNENSELIDLQEINNCDSYQPEVMMHIITDNINNVDFKKLTPIVTKISNNHKKFKFSLIIVNKDANYVKHAEQMNKDALDSITGKVKKHKNIKRTKVEYTTLANILNNSPLKKIWHKIPDQLISFLVRAVSVWEKGGIAFNPLVLLPDTVDNKYYYEHITTVLKNYSPRISNEDTEEKLYALTKKPLVNNIQDIINALESGVSTLGVQENLTEAETKSKVQTTGLKKDNVSFKVNVTHENDSSPEFNIDFKQSNITNYSGLLPRIFNVFKVESLEKEERKKRAPQNDSNKTTNDKSVIEESPKMKNESQKNHNIIKLTLDSKGELVAVDVPCHAFLGTAFTNVLHHPHAISITDFIHDELTSFCNGDVKLCHSKNITII